MSTTLFLLGIVLLIAGIVIGWFLNQLRLKESIKHLKLDLEFNENEVKILKEQITSLDNELKGFTSQYQEKEVELARIQVEKLSLAENFKKQEENLKLWNDKYEGLQKELNLSSQEKVKFQAEFENKERELSVLNESYKLKENALDELQKQYHELETRAVQASTQLEEKEKRLKDQEDFINQADKKLRDAFMALSSDALKNNNNSFINLAKSTLEVHLTEAKGDFENRKKAIELLVIPLNESLKTMDTKINELEITRAKAYTGLSQYLEHFGKTTEGLKKETSNLVGALKTSYTRGRYGEIALRRLVEFAGMIDRCHFMEQVSGEEGARLRPDMIIELPENKKLVVDSKVPLDSYLKIFETDDPEQQKIYLKRHTDAVKDHLKRLSAKSYWSQFPEAPDFVIMYMQIESSFGSALEACPELIEEAFHHQIIIATPTILISILMSIGYSWNQIHTMENIEEIRSAAVELYDRSTVYIEHMSKVGHSLEGTVKHFNNAVGSLEGNFMPQARKISALSIGYTKKILEQLEPVEIVVRKTAISETEPVMDQNKNPSV